MPASILDDIMSDRLYKVDPFKQKVNATFDFPEGVNGMEMFSAVYDTINRKLSELGFTDIKDASPSGDQFKRMAVSRGGKFVYIDLYPRMVTLHVSGVDGSNLDMAKKLAKIIQDLNSNLNTTLERDIPRGSTDPVTYDDIEEGDVLVDFDDEYKFGRYYKKSTFSSLRNKNPFKNTVIQTNPTYYKAHLVDKGGKRRRKTHRRLVKRKKTRKSRY